MDLAYFDKLAKGNHDVNYLLVRQDMFDRAIDAKGRKNKASKETFMYFWLWLQKRMDPQKVG